MFRYVIFSAIGLNALVVLDILFSKNVNILEMILAISMSALLILVYSLTMQQETTCEISKALYNGQCDLLAEIKKLRKLLEEKGEIKNEQD